MDLRVSLLVAVLSVALVAEATASAGSLHAQPAYFVSSLKSFTLGDEVDYEAWSPAVLSSHIISSLKGAVSTGSPHPEALLVVVPGNPTPDASFSVEDADSLVDLKKLIQEAPSSTVFTSVGASCDGGSLKDALLSSELSIQNKVISEIKLGGHCAPSSPSDDIQDFVKSWTGGSKKDGVALLVFCAPPTHSPSSSAFLEAYQELERSTTGVAALFLPSTAAVDSSACRRSLLLTGSASNSTSCGPTCQTKATLLEAAFVTIVLLIALVAGLSCLAGLDSPSKFETPRESS